MNMSRIKWAFGLWTLLVLLTVVCLFIGIVVQRLAHVRADVATARELEAIARSRPVGFDKYDTPCWEVLRSDGHGRVTRLEVPIREALAIWRAPGGIRVRYTARSGSPNNEELELCNSFERIVSLSFSSPAHLTDEQFAMVTATNYLTQLHVSGNPLHDESARRIGAMTNLKWLILSNTAITDKGVCYLSGLRQLEILDLSGNAIKDAGAKCLGELTSLKDLSLDHTWLTDEAAIHLKKLRGLRSLRLSGTDITDAGLRQLTSLENLETIALDNTRVTNEAISILEKLPRLREAELETGDIDAQEAAAFQQRLSARLP